MASGHRRETDAKRIDIHHLSDTGLGVCPLRRTATGSDPAVRQSGCRTDVPPRPATAPKSSVLTQVYTSIGRRAEKRGNPGQYSSRSGPRWTGSFVNRTGPLVDSSKSPGGRTHEDEFAGRAGRAA